MIFIAVFAENLYYQENHSSQGDKMKSRLIGVVGLAIFAVAATSAVFAQDRTLRSVAGDKWVISAKAGAANFVQGSVNVTRAGGKSGLLIKGDSVDVGDRVWTGADGRAEILLNPGSYLRVAENSAFEFKTTELEDLQVLAVKGSIMLEVFAANDFQVSVSTPKQSFDLIETGVYRIDVAADGTGRIEVWKGKAEVGDAVLKGGKAVNGLDGQIAKFDRDDRDAFETWSRDRAKELAKATNNLRDRTLRTSLMRSFLGGGWNVHNSFGLWVYDARFGRYCFLPFGYGWSSPYGFGFGTDIWWYRLPQAVYYPPMNGPVAGNPPSGGTPPAGTPPGGGTPPRRGPVLGGRKQDPEGSERKDPPFVRMQGNGRGTGRDFGGFDPTSSSGGSSRGSGDFGRATPSGFPSGSSAPSAPAPRAEPPISRGVGPIRGKDPIN
jgi:hypothetical protein